MIEYIREFEGIIGAVLGATFGTVATLSTTKIMQKIGKTNIFVSDHNVKFLSKEETQMSGSGKRESLPFDEAVMLTVRTSIEFYNSSDSPKIIRNFAVSFRDNRNKELENVKPKNLSTTKNVKTSIGGYLSTSDLTILNLPPKEIISIPIESTISDEKISLSNVRYVYLTGENEKGKSIKKLIKIIK